jgi:hypothetical protein
MNAPVKMGPIRRPETPVRCTLPNIPEDSFEKIEEFKYLGTTLTNQNSIKEEIKSRLQSGNACCHSVQNILSSSLLSKNIKIKVYCLLFCVGVKHGRSP